MFFVYLIISTNDQPNTYVGYTNNIFKRIISHNAGKGAKYTKGRFWKLAYFEKFNSKKVAMKREYELKKDYKFRKTLKNLFTLAHSIKTRNFK